MIAAILGSDELKRKGGDRFLKFGKQNVEVVDFCRGGECEEDE